LEGWVAGGKGAKEVTIRIRNWANYQHYSDRCPPWIKLHVSILSSEDWVTLDDRGRVLAVVCLVLASRKNGEIPSDTTYIRRVAYLDYVPDLSPLIRCGFLTSDEPLAVASTMLADATTEKSREEKRREDQTPLPPRGNEGVSKAKGTLSAWGTWTPDQFTREAITANADGMLTDMELASFCEYWLAPTKSGRPLFTQQKSWNMKLRQRTALARVYGPQRENAGMTGGAQHVQRSRYDNVI
jgi:hypothetical protein